MKRRVAQTLIVVLLSAILEMIFISVGMMSGIIAVAAIATITILYIQGLCFYDIGLILMPFMFYLNIGGAVKYFSSRFYYCNLAFRSNEQ